MLSNSYHNYQQWLQGKGYLQGVFWIVLVSIISNTNDICMRLLGERLPATQVVFCRFSFAACMMFAIMLHLGKQTFATARPMLHLVRALVGFLAVTLWCHGVTLAPLAIAATMALTVPIFVLILAYWFLHEVIGWQRLLATLLGFLGILIIALPGQYNLGLQNLNYAAMALVGSALLFAVSDILNKAMVKHEGMHAMLFYFALGTSLAGSIPAWYSWISPTAMEWCMLGLLGIGGNAILFCLLKAFSAADISALAPYRYLELIFATAFGYLLFNEIPKVNTFVGASIIVFATLAISYYEINKLKNTNS